MKSILTELCPQLVHFCARYLRYIQKFQINNNKKKRNLIVLEKRTGQILMMNNDTCLVFLGPSN